jgi:ubiquinone/menaquinone biosynthesis C-methylase UbiE
MILETAERFTGRVDRYRQHRPRYPEAIVSLLQEKCGLTNRSTVADIAAGTGLLSEIFLAHDYEVVAVEPNDEMRAACGVLTEHFSRFRCLSGSAEATGLPASSSDLITVGQALHWFDLERARAEFVRILRPGGWCAVVYNERRMGGDAFHAGYETLLQDFGIDYAKVQRQHLTAERMQAFFAPATMRRAVFPNAQQFTLEALEGRIVSSSYMPTPEHPRYAAMQAAIRGFFQQHQKDNQVTLAYDCAVSYGQIA